VTAGRISVDLIVPGSLIDGTTRRLITSADGLSYVEINTAKQLVVSCAGTTWTTALSVGTPSSDLELSVEAGGGSVASKARARIVGASTRPWDLQGAQVAAPIQPYVATDPSPTVAASVTASLTLPTWSTRWLPTDLGSRLALYLRSDLGITLNSGKVAAWACQAGTGRSATQATPAYQPLYGSDAGVPDIEGGAAGVLVLSSLAALPTAAAEMFVIGKGASGGGTSWDMSSASPAVSHFGYPETAPNASIYEETLTATRYGPILLPSATCDARWAYNVRTSGTNWSCHVNGLQRYSVTSNTMSWHDTPQLRALGAMKLFEFMLVSGGNLTTTERDALHAYTTTDYGVAFS
jgi:hypothetical protein